MTCWPGPRRCVGSRGGNTSCSRALASITRGSQRRRRICCRSAGSSRDSIGRPPPSWRRFEKSVPRRTGSWRGYGARRLSMNGPLASWKSPRCASRGSSGNSRRRAAASLRPRSAGEGVARLKGQLNWPSDGDVVASFGRQKHPKFNTYVQRKGIEIRAAQGSVIRSVADGVVAFADWMRGYGLLTIVDHGEGFFSLYAHASKLLVNVGETVRSNQPIGEIGDTGLTGENTLYFELRQRGQALDPLAWLARRR